MKDLYAVLGCDISDGIDAIKRKYRQKALQCHPDKVDHADSQSHEAFVELNEAYEILGNFQLREKYDEEYARNRSQTSVGRGAPHSNDELVNLRGDDEVDEENSEEDMYDSSVTTFLDGFLRTTRKPSLSDPLLDEFLLHHEEVERRKKKMAAMWDDLFKDKRHIKENTHVSMPPRNLSVLDGDTTSSSRSSIRPCSRQIHTPSSRHHIANMQAIPRARTAPELQSSQHPSSSSRPTSSSVVPPVRANQPQPLLNVKELVGNRQHSQPPLSAHRRHSSSFGSTTPNAYQHIGTPASRSVSQQFCPTAFAVFGQNGHATTSLISSSSSNSRATTTIDEILPITPDFSPFHLSGRGRHTTNSSTNNAPLLRPPSSSKHPDGQRETRNFFFVSSSGGGGVFELDTPTTNAVVHQTANMMNMNSPECDMDDDTTPHDVKSNRAATPTTTPTPLFRRSTTKQQKSVVNAIVRPQQQQLCTAANTQILCTTLTVAVDDDDEPSTDNNTTTCPSPPSPPLEEQSMTSTTIQTQPPHSHQADADPILLPTRQKTTSMISHNNSNTNISPSSLLHPSSDIANEKGRGRVIFPRPRSSSDAEVVGKQPTPSSSSSTTITTFSATAATPAAQNMDDTTMNAVGVMPFSFPQMPLGNSHQSPNCSISKSAVARASMDTVVMRMQKLKQFRNNRTISIPQSTNPSSYDPFLGNFCTMPNIQHLRLQGNSWPLSHGASRSKQPAKEHRSAAGKSPVKPHIGFLPTHHRPCMVPSSPTSIINKCV
jgi:curved DNA-binding protein CbpA